MVETWLYLFLAIWSWENYIISLCFSFHIYKNVRDNNSEYFSSVEKIKCINSYETLRIVPIDKKRHSIKIRLHYIIFLLLSHTHISQRSSSICTCRSILFFAMVTCIFFSYAVEHQYHHCVLILHKWANIYLGYSLKGRITGSQNITYTVFRSDGPTTNNQWQKSVQIYLILEDALEKGLWRVL